MFQFKTRDDFQKMVDAQVEETLTLDYKASPALTRDSKNVDELCKDVSAMANSAGGQLIYGIEEDKKTHKLKAVDDGVADEKITREWLHQILSSRIQPRIDGITIDRIPLSDKSNGFVINVSQSLIGPHQAPDKKYYKRFELESKAMEDYEIRDILRRATTPNLNVKLSLPHSDKHQVEFPPHQEWSKSILLGVTVSNTSPTPAYHAIVEVFIDAVLVVPFATQFTQSGSAENPPGRRFKIMRWTISSPPGVPIFEGADHESHFGQIPIQLPSTLLHSSIIYLETEVRAPGVSKHEKWAIHSTGGVLTLYDPNDPFVKTA
jgi:hypothetical protein